MQRDAISQSLLCHRELIGKFIGFMAYCLHSLLVEVVNLKEKVLSLVDYEAIWAFLVDVVNVLAYILQIEDIVDSVAHGLNLSYVFFSFCY